MASGRLLFALTLVLGLVGCKKDDPSVCDPDDESTCSGGQVCEFVRDGDPACFDPVVVRGRVADGSESTAIAGASIVVLDANGSAIAGPVSSNTSGDYSVTVPTERDAEGAILPTKVTLRVDASGYVAFPTPPRFALPIELSTAVSTDGSLIVDDPTTDVSLFALPETLPPTTYGTIRGSIDGPYVAGALVVAEQGAPASAVATAIVDGDGNYVLFNVPTGATTTVTAYAAGVHVTAATTTVPGEGDELTLVLHADTEGLSTVTGSITTRNAPNFPSTGTSIVLVVESTYLDGVGRGQMPTGLRVGGVSNDFTIEDVPPGRYVVLAAFENDLEVRDPDVSLGGNDVVVIETTLAGTPVDAGSFSVTDALPVISPGAAGLDVVTSVTSFQWRDDSGEDGYEWVLYDSYGIVVSSDLNVPKHTGGATVTYTPAVLTLEAGQIYQFRVKSFADGVGGREYLSASEDLLGVFQYQP